MTPAEWEYATDDYKEHRKIIDKSISGKENVDKTSESTLTNDQIKEFKEEHKMLKTVMALEVLLTI